MKELAPFYEAVSDPAALAGRIPLRKTIGTMCSYAPEELIYAAGFHPMRLFSSKSDILFSEKHLQAYCCSLVRGVLEDSLAGRLDFLSGAVFPHTCDSVQRLSDIWRLNTRYEFFADVVLPVKLDTQSARTYMAAVMKRFKADLEAATDTPITDDALGDAIRLYNRIRKGLSRIYSVKSRHPGCLSSRDLFTLVKGAMIMDRAELADRLDTIAGLLETDPPQATDPPPAGNAKRLILSGSVCDMPDLYDLLEVAGAVVVADDLCTGQRWFEGLVAETGSPLDALADRYAQRTICPAKHRGTTARADHLTSLARESKADGVIFVLLKFCDPHAFDYPYLKAALDSAGIKSLHLELDDQQNSMGQLATRLETFIHMI